MHFWEKKKIEAILERNRKLRTYQRRMQAFAVVKDDDVTLVSHQILVNRRIMMFRDVKRRGKAAVTSIKIAQARKRRAAA